MKPRTRRLLALLLTVAAWSAMLAGASANRLSSSSQSIRFIWRSLIFENTARNANWLCPVTLEGTFHSKTIVKTIGSLIGFITRASIKSEEPPCTGGTLTILSASLPWHIRYEGFRGTLPRLEGVNLLLVGPAFRIHPTGSISCLASAEARHPVGGIANIEAGGRVTELTPEQGKTIPLTGEGGLCTFGGEGVFSEREHASVTNETGGALTITLI